jgi:hypothetical protein
MFSLLSLNVFHEIVSYIKPHEFKSLYLSLQNELLKQCIVKCTWYIETKLMKWFQQNEIQLILYREMNDEVKGEIHWYTNGALHSENDEPALICDHGFHGWYKMGVMYKCGWKNNGKWTRIINAHLQMDMNYFFKHGIGVYHIIEDI